MVRSILISGTIICLDDVVSISPIKKWKDYYKDFHFEFSYRSYNGVAQSVVISHSDEYENYFLHDGRLTVTTKENLSDIRDRVVELVKGNL
jgi:hypothetical protein